MSMKVPLSVSWSRAALTSKRLTVTEQRIGSTSELSEWGGTCLSLVSSWATPLTFELGEMRVGVIAFVLAVVAVAVVAVVPDMDRDGILDS